MQSCNWGRRSADLGWVVRDDRFERMSAWASHAAGCRSGFRIAVLMLAGWLTTGPLVRFHETWTTSFTVVTTSITFLLLFLIQASQSRELKAVHLKLDELIYSAARARNELINAEYLTEEQLDALALRYAHLAIKNQADNID